MMLTNNTPTNNWDEPPRETTPHRARRTAPFDRAPAFVIKGASFRRAKLEIFSVESSPIAIKVSK